MFRFLAFIMGRFPAFKRWGNRLFYQFLAGIDEKRGEVTLMNYGFTPLEANAKPIAMDPADEGNRLCLQLYHHVAGAVDVKGRDMLEVGSGRGGGASYVRRTFKPRSMTGVDYSERAVRFCQRVHQHEGLTYVHGDAEALPFEDARFDVVINVESSHCYGSMPRFLSEVHRVLRPGGRLSWADIRTPSDMVKLEEEMRACGFQIEKAQTITDNVLASMAEQGARYKALIDSRVPGYARGLFYSFAGVEGTMVPTQLQSGELSYQHRVLVKAG